MGKKGLSGGHPNTQTYRHRYIDTVYTSTCIYLYMHIFIYIYIQDIFFCPHVVSFILYQGLLSAQTCSLIYMENDS